MRLTNRDHDCAGDVTLASFTFTHKGLVVRGSRREWIEVGIATKLTRFT